MPPKVKRAGSRKTVSVANLADLGAERLAAILMSEAEDDPALKRRLRMELAGEVGAEHLAAELAKRLTAIETRRSRVHWRKYKGFVRELELIRQMITGPLADQDASLALDHFMRFLELANGLFDLVDDSRGEVEAVFGRAVEGAGALASRVHPGATWLERMAALLETDDEQIFGDLVGEISPHLAPELLERLHVRLAEVQAARRRPAPSLRKALQAIADARGDVDAYAATMSDSEAKLPFAGAEIGRRLLTAGRVEDALAALARSAPPPGARTLLPGVREWEEVYIQALEADGQAELAQDERWAAFQRRLDPERLRSFLRKLPDFDDVEAQDRAFAFAHQYPHFTESLGFFTAWPAAGEAAALVMRRHGDINPDKPEVLEPAVRLLETRHPAAASLLLRAMIADTLRWGRADRYKDAQRQLAELGALAPQVADWGALESHDAFLARMARVRRI